MDQVDRLRHEVDDFWGVPREEAECLAQLVRLARARSICEIGASYGYSTLHLAAAASEHGGHVHTFDIDPRKVDIVKKHLQQANLDRYATIHHGDARELLPDVRLQNKFDFVFIDAVKDQCHEYLEQLWPHLASQAAILTDNINTHTDQLQAFISYLRTHARLKSTVINVGNGLELSIFNQ